jgi:hypothetical protein
MDWSGCKQVSKKKSDLSNCLGLTNLIFAFIEYNKYQLAYIMIHKITKYIKTQGL